MQAHPQLQEFLQAYSPKIQELFWHLRSFILHQDENANELIWDNYNALAIAYSRSKKLKDAYAHLAMYTHHVNFGFNRGATLRQDIIPLAGSGKLIRHIKITKQEEVNQDALSKLILEARTICLSMNPNLEQMKTQPVSIVMSIATKKIRPKK